jgi:ubiquinol-cytochrome c reductase cytochrome c1 subunit
MIAMKRQLSYLLIATSAAALLAAVPVSAAESGHAEIERQQWSFGGFKGQFDKAQLQRGFQIYKEVCSACHGLSRVNFRNLVQPGGPEFPEEAVKALAASWPNQISELNDAGESAIATKDKDGKTSGFSYVKRAPLLSDPILGPYANEKAARAAQNGALPPDLSLIAKARGVERDPKWWIHPFLMLGDIFRSYQEGGADYVRALLAGYVDAPADVKMNDGMYYNAVFPGHQLAMPPPLSDGAVTYQDGTKPTVDNYARDVAAFLSWTADPSLDQRKRIGWQVMLYLLITTVLLYLGKRRIWADVEH